MWIEPAYAQTAQQGGGDILGLLTPMIIIFGIMYFLLIRPQQKKQKRHQEKLEAVKRGDKVITGGGIYGTVRRVGDEGRLMVEIAKDVQIEVAASTLADVLLKPEPQATANKQTSGGLLGGLFGKKELEATAKAKEEKPEEKPKKKPKKQKTGTDKDDNSDSADGKDEGA